MFRRKDDKMEEMALTVETLLFRVSSLECKVRNLEKDLKHKVADGDEEKPKRGRGRPRKTDK